MKKLIFILCFSFAAIFSFAQSGFPNNQSISSASTLYHAKGGLVGDSGLVVISFPDTATANLGTYIKNTNGLLIKVHDTLFMRDVSKSKWLKIITGSTTVINFPGVDTVTYVNDTICFVINSLPICYALGRYYDSVSLNLDSTYMKFWNKGNFMDSIWVPHDNVYAVPPLYVTTYNSVNNPIEDSVVFTIDTTGFGGGGNDSAYVNGRQLTDTSFSLIRDNGDSTVFSFSGGSSGALTLQEVLDLENGNAQLDKADTITTNNNTLKIGDLFGGNLNGFQLSPGQSQIEASYNSSGNDTKVQVNTDTEGSSFSLNAGRNSGSYSNIFGSSNDTDPSSLNYTADLQTFNATELRINSTLGGASVGYVWTLTDAGTGAGSWQAGGGGGGIASVTGDLVDNTDPLNPIVGLSGTHTIGGDAIIDMSSFSLTVNKTGYTPLRIQNGSVDMSGYNPAGAGQSSQLGVSTTSSTASFDINAFFDDGVNGTEISAFSDATGGVITYTASTSHTFIGPIINDADSSASPFNVVTIDENNQLRRAAYPSGGGGGGIGDSTYFWPLTGKYATDTLLNFFGTKDYKPVIFKMNGVRSGQISDSVTNNTAFGYGSMRLSPLSRAVSATTGEGNTAFGTLTLSVNTYASGSFNTAIGASVLKSNTAGANNVGVGYQALFSNVSSSNNVAVGRKALFALASGGDNNTAIGDFSLFAATSGNRNIAIGSSVMSSTTSPGDDVIAIGNNALTSNTGNSNVGIGTNALHANTSGQLQVAVGTSALAANTSGTFNTAVGRAALTSNTTGSYNNAFGLNTMFSNTTGDQNTAVGNSSLFSNVLGSFNTMVGYNAGSDTLAGGGGTGNTRLDSSTFIGADTRSKARGLTNEIIIGANAVSLGSRTAVIGTSLQSLLGVWGDIQLMATGKKLIIPTGSNASVGASVLVGGTVTVSTTAVGATSKIFLTNGVTGGIPGIPSVGTITGGTSFIINSSNPADTSTINWWIINN